MRTPRTEIISVDTDRLARHAFARTEFACIQALPMADGKTLLTVTAAGDWNGNAGYYWFRNKRDATRILDEVVTLEAMPWTASRIEGGVLVEASNVDAVISECLKWQPSVRIVSAEEINAHIASIKQDLDRSLVRWQVTGAMQALNRQYKELRTSPRAEGEKIPSFKVWLTAQFEAQIILQPVPGSL
jgi:hypothetical protein